MIHDNQTVASTTYVKSDSAEEMLQRAITRFGWTREEALNRAVVLLGIAEQALRDGHHIAVVNANMERDIDGEVFVPMRHLIVGFDSEETNRE